MRSLYNSLKIISANLAEGAYNFSCLCLEEITGRTTRIIKTRRDSDEDRPHYKNPTNPNHDINDKNHPYNRTRGTPS